MMKGKQGRLETIDQIEQRVFILPVGSNQSVASQVID